MTERAYQKHVLQRLEERFPGCMLIKNDPDYRQGILDWTILWGKRWGMLEIKASRRSRHQPNQDYYVELFNDMSFAAFIYPENEEEVLRALEQALAPRRRTRVSQPQ